MVNETAGENTNFDRDTLQKAPEPLGKQPADERVTFTEQPTSLQDLANGVADTGGQEAVDQETRPEVTTYNDRVQMYKVFQETLHPKADVVYHPASGNDSSPSVAFPDSRIIYADIDPLSVAALKTAGLEVHAESAETYDPGEVDVLILINPSIRPDTPSQFVAPEGHILCNDYHQTASFLNENPAYELKGLVRRTENDEFVMDTEDPSGYLETVETDEEWKKVDAAGYEDAAAAVEAVTGARENVVENYQNYVAKALEDQRAALITDFGETEESAVDMQKDAETMMMLDLPLVYQHEDKSIPVKPVPMRKDMIQRPSPDDDIFVFQKKAT